MSFAANCSICLCKVCNSVKCPNPYNTLHKFRGVPREWKKNPHIDMCARRIVNEDCPIIQCDYFHHKQLSTYYMIKYRRPKREDVIMEKLEELENQLKYLAEKLEKRDGK